MNINYSEDRMFPVASDGKPEHNFKMIVALLFQYVGLASSISPAAVRRSS